MQVNIDFIFTTDILKNETLNYGFNNKITGGA